MKIAFLLTLHNNSEQANLFIKQLLEYKHSYIFIHIDAKGLAIKDKIIKDERIVIVPKSFLVEWGDFSQIEAILYLMSYVKERGPFDYYSLHSGSDLLVRPVEELVEYLKKDHKYAYTLCDRLPSQNWQYGGGLGRIALNWPKVFRKRCSRYSVRRYIRSLYGKLYGAGILPGKKIPLNIEFYGRSDWFTLSEACVKDILEYTDAHQEFLDLFKNSLSGSEIYFTTIAHMKGDTSVMDSENNLRYIDFVNVDPETPGSPKLLRSSDYKAIIESKMFFARKFDISVDPNIMNEFLKNNDESEAK